MKAKTLIISLCAVFLLVFPSFAASWYWIGQGEDGENLYIDNGSVDKTSSRAILWLLITDVPYPNKYNAKQILFKVYILPNATGGWEYMQLQHPDGTITQYNNNLEIHPLPPDSVGYKVWQATY